MKILISILILNIVFFMNFNDLNAAENQGSSSESSLGSGRQREGSRRGAILARGREKKRQDGPVRGKFRINPYHRKPDVVIGPSWGFVEHMGQKIEVWLDVSKTRIIKADYPGNGYPSSKDYKSKNFLVRLAPLREGLQIVECINQDGTLMGVRAPRITTANIMEPSSTQWFVLYFRKCFRVRINPETKKPVGISLASANIHGAVQGRRAELVDIAGFKFFVVRGEPHFDIMGAELSRRPALPTVVNNFRDLIS